MPAAIKVTKGIVEFRDVRFAYADGAKPVIENFWMRTGAGERVGISGTVGRRKIDAPQTVGAALRRSERPDSD